MKKTCSITSERYEQIKEIVADMYEDLGYTEIPVNVFELCHKLNIKLIRYSSLSEDCYEYSRQFSDDGFNLFNVDTFQYQIYYNDRMLLNRLIASYWQGLGRSVIITLSWARKETYNTAFSNIEKGCIVGIATEGVSDWECFEKGFLEMLERIEPSKICWYDRVPEWVSNYYDTENIIIMKKRHKAVKEREFKKILETQLFLF